MKNNVWKLHNVIKNYEWGSHDALTHLFNIKNPQKQPQAEIWMGVHPAGCSIAVNSLGEQTRLDQLIATYPKQILGERTYHQFNGLPFLFKVLAAAKPLSIQVHPEKNKAEQGFKKENQQKIALDAPNRNYKDANHKPELVYAISDYQAMNGFKPITEILSYFSQFSCPSLLHQVNALAQNQIPAQLKQFFKSLLTLSDIEKKQTIDELMIAITHTKDPIGLLIKQLAKAYPDDIGLFTPMLLNVITLKPGQAMYLDAETPHAYLQGVGMEIMANSDNVLRAGLTPKYIDVPELLDNTKFNSIALSHLLTTAQHKSHQIDFPVPVPDFKFSILLSDNQQHAIKVESAEILFCLSGKITIATSSENWIIEAGESLFISYSAEQYTYSGKGQIARAYN